jgi:hypothetical protein
MNRWSAKMFLRMYVFGLVLILSPQVQSNPSPLLKDAASIQAKVESLRGQAISGKLKMGVVSKPEILNFLEERITEEYSSEEFRRAELQLKLLELVPWDYNYRAELKSIYADQIGGFYDHKKQELYIADWLPAFSQKPVLAHEIFHAVQVQEWKTAPLLDSKTIPTDQLLAHQALLEGDATIVMMQYVADGLNQDVQALETMLEQTKSGMMRQLGMSAKLAVFTGGSANFANAPRYIKRSLVMPYVLGAQFVWALKTNAKMTWQQINQIYKTPPSTTEHILSPRTYWESRDRRVAPPKIPHNAVRWTCTDEDTFGVFMISEALERNEDHAKLPLILRGWAGDELLLFESEKTSAIVLNSIWDDEASAQTFAQTWQKRYPDSGRIFVETRGKVVIILISQTPSNSMSLAQELGLRTAP